MEKELKNIEMIGDSTLFAIREVEMARKRKTGVNGVPSGFTELDRITSGWQGSDLIILAGRPSMGKTALALTLATNAAIKFKLPVAVFSLEMSNLQLAQRLMSSETELGMEKLRKGQLQGHEYEQLTTKITSLATAHIYIDDSARLTISEFEEKARALKKEKNIQLIILDYVQLLRTDFDGKGNREQEISYITRGLKSLAKELNIPIIALSQLSRAVELRGGAKRPQLTDLRDSGALEEDADMVLFVYRQEYYGNDGYDDLPPDAAEIIIAKHRNGPLGNVHLKFQKEFAKFVEYEPSMGDYHQYESAGDAPSKIIQSKNWSE